MDTNTVYIYMVFDPSPKSICSTDQFDLNTTAADVGRIRNKTQQCFRYADKDEADTLQIWDDHAMSQTSQLKLEAEH
jgi:hypothetical protein